MFGGSLFGENDQDPFFAMHQQQMQRMNSMMMDPFGMMGRPNVPQIQDSHRRGDHRSHRHQQVAARDPFGGDIFSHMNQMMGNMNHMMANMHSQMQMANMQQPHMMQAGQQGAPVYSHSSVMTYSNDGRGGQPKVFQATKTTTQAGNGMRETKKTVRDSEQGVAKMAIDRQIGDRRHCITKHKDMRTGDLTENHDYNNLDEEEAHAFHEEFQQRSTRQALPRQQRALTGARHSPHHRPTNHRSHHRDRQH